MLQHAGRARLLLEAPQSMLIGCKLCRQNFDGDISSDARVACPEYLTHAAGANGTGDDVGPESGARGERHGLILTQWRSLRAILCMFGRLERESSARCATADGFWSRCMGGPF